MGEKPVNPPAFPRPSVPGYSHEQSQDGMTLRDYFAGQALVAIMTDRDFPGEHGPQIIAGYAYDIADAMLRERESPS